jgi:hypothetical protein
LRPYVKGRTVGLTNALVLVRSVYDILVRIVINSGGRGGVQRRRYYRAILALQLGVYMIRCVVRF